MKPDALSRRTFVQSMAIAAAGVAAEPVFAAAPELASLTLKQASELLRKKAASPVELTRACLERIETYNPKLNAYITVSGDSALASAREMEAELRKGKWRGPLHGVPIALKDNIDTAGTLTTAASELFKDRVPSEDADVVRRLKRAGAVLLGKLNLHEFAYGITSDTSYFGPVRNPWSLDRVAGGSSGGSAAAIAADLCFASLGTDTAGSVRIPSAFCGTVGFKPTYGRVSLRGVIPLSWSLDHVGPICKTVEDAALVLGVIAGYDPLDPTSVNQPVPDYVRALTTKTSALRLGVPRSPFFDGLDAEIAKAVEAAIDVLRKMTRSMTESQLPPTGSMASIIGAEAYAYHSKWIVESPERYQAATRERLIRTADGKAAAYANALRQTSLLRREISTAFSQVDVLITPTMARPPEVLGPGTSTPPIGVRNTQPFNVLGLPTISIPCGFTSSGLPIGLQLSGAPFAESTVLALAHAYERETDWHTRSPPLRAD